MSGQTRRGSLTEAGVNICVGLGVSYLGNLWFLPLVGLSVSMSQNVTLCALFTALSFVRSYVLRRAFNFLQVLKS